MSRETRREKDDGKITPNADSTTFIYIGGCVLAVGTVGFVLWKAIQDLKVKVDPIAADNVSLASYVSLFEKTHSDALLQHEKAIQELRTRNDDPIKKDVGAIAVQLNELIRSHNQLAQHFANLKGEHDKLKLEVEKLKDNNEDLSGLLRNALATMKKPQNGYVATTRPKPIVNETDDERPSKPKKKDLSPLPSDTEEEYKKPPKPETKKKHSISDIDEDEEEDKKKKDTKTKKSEPKVFVDKPLDDKEMRSSSRIKERIEKLKQGVPALSDAEN
jgi:hypothetical protein